MCSGQRLYWSDLGTEVIESSGLLGGDRQTLRNLTGDFIPYSVEVYNGSVYWGDSISVTRLDLLQRNITRYWLGSSIHPGGLQIYKGDLRLVHMTARKKCCKILLDLICVQL